MRAAPSGTRPLAVLWHDCECGGYAVDLPIWERLAGERQGPVLDLGAGTGRVALHLAARGHEVAAVEVEPVLAEALRERAAARGLAVEVTTQDVERLSLPRAFPLVLAPMQLLQMLPGREHRQRALAAIAAHLAPGGVLAAAIVEGRPAETLGDAPALPDVREHGGWIYSSLPVAVDDVPGRLVVRRLRQVVSPAGELSESTASEELHVIDAGELEREAAAAGLAAAGRIAVAATEAHVGSTVVLLKRREPAR